MDTKILRSIASLALVVALGVGATYAAFTSNTVTIANNTMAAGSAALKLCKSTGANDWRNLVDPGLTVGDLAPGAAFTELTGHTIHLGNDDGSLEDAVADACATYFDTAGNSVVDLFIVPTVTLAPETDCTVPGLEEHLELAVVLGGDTPAEEDFLTLTEWSLNTAAIDTLAVGVAEQVHMYGRLSTDAPNEMQGATCTFDLNFMGDQEEPTISLE